MFGLSRKLTGVIEDRPDPRTFHAEHILGAPLAGVEDDELPKEVNLRTKAEQKARDQKRTNHCTAYEAEILHSIQNSIEHDERLIFDPIEQWTNQLVNPGTATEEKGDYLESALMSLNLFGLHLKGKKYSIDGFARVSKKNLKRYLADNKVIYTGCRTTKTNMARAGRTGIWGGHDGQFVGGHAFAITGYKVDKMGKTWYIATNSWGDKWGRWKNGEFFIAEKDIMLIFTPYIVYDSKDLERPNPIPEVDEVIKPNFIFRDLNDNSWAFDSVDWAAKNGVMKGHGDEEDPNTEKFFKPNEPITRAEFCVALKRYHETRRALNTDK